MRLWHQLWTATAAAVIYTATIHFRRGMDSNLRMGATRGGGDEGGGDECRYADSDNEDTGGPSVDFVSRRVGEMQYLNSTDVEWACRRAQADIDARKYPAITKEAYWFMHLRSLLERHVRCREDKLNGAPDWIGDLECQSGSNQKYVSATRTMRRLGTIPPDGFVAMFDGYWTVDALDGYIEREYGGAVPCQAVALSDEEATAALTLTMRHRPGDVTLVLPRTKADIIDIQEKLAGAGGRLLVRCRKGGAYILYEGAEAVCMQYHDLYRTRLGALLSLHSREVLLHAHPHIALVVTCQRRKALVYDVECQHSRRGRKRKRATLRDSSRESSRSSRGGVGVRGGS